MKPTKTTDAQDLLDRCRAAGLEVYLTSDDTILWYDTRDDDEALPLLAELKDMKSPVIALLRSIPERNLYDPFTQPPGHLRERRFRRVVIEDGEPVAFVPDGEGEFIWGDHVGLYVFFDAVERWREVYGKV